MAARASGGSPLENVATICPLPIGFPQVSTSVNASGVGHEAGAEKLLTRPVCVGTSCLSAQEAAARGNDLAPDAPPGVPVEAVASTISVTLTERTALANEKLTLPR